MRQLHVDIDVCDGATRVFVHGELDVATIPLWHRRMAEVRHDHGDPVVVDAADLRFAGIRGASAVISEIRALRRDRRRVCVANLNPNVRRVFELLALDAELVDSSSMA